MRLISTLEEAKSVLRKIDLRSCPPYGYLHAAVLDKSSISFASVYGLQAGTHLVGQQYSWLSSIFYFGESCIKWSTDRQSSEQHING